MRPYTRWTMAPLLTLLAVSSALGATPRSGASCEVSSPPVQASIAIGDQPESDPKRLRLVTHTGALRVLPPHSSSIDPFNVPWTHHADRFGIAGALDLWQGSKWRFGVQAEGVYTRHGMPFYVHGFNRWRRRIVLYGTYDGDGWTVTIGVVVHDTGAQRRLGEVLAADSRGARRDCVSEFANRKAGKSRTALRRRPARNMRKVNPRDDVLERSSTGIRHRTTRSSWTH